MIATVKAGDIDLSTATGRMQARIVAAVARHESERIAERVSDKKRELAAQGRPAGGGRRPFGFLADRVTLHPTEAPLLAAAAARVATGQSSYAQEADLLNEAGVTTTSGVLWTIRSLSRACCSPRSAGLRAYKGTILRDAVWPAIVDRQHWDTLQAMAATRRHGGRPATTSYLLRGLLECGRCGRRLYGNTTPTGPVYRCVPTRTGTGRGCGSCQVKATVLDRLVLDEIRGWLDAGDLDAISSQPDGDTGRAVRAQVELEQLAQRRGLLTERFVDGRMTPAEYDTAMGRAEVKRVELEGLMAGVPAPVSGLEGLTLGEVLDALDGEAVHARRVVEALAVTPIVVAPAGKRGVPTPVGERVAVRPRWA